MINYDDESITDVQSDFFPISEEEETFLTSSEAPSIEVGSASHERTSIIWNDFDRVLVDGVYKIKYKKYIKLYSCTSLEKLTI